MTNTHNVSCISDFLDVIREFNESYSILGASPVSCRFLYRGLSNEGYKLIPAIFRVSHDYDITFSGLTDKEHNGFIDNKKYTAFSSEKAILREFIAQACAYINEDPTQDLNKWVEYAQHYGVPTRILDWTENPLVALYFACRDDKPDYKDSSITGKNAVVWMIHFSNYKRFRYELSRKSQPQKSNDVLTIGEIINQLINGEQPIEYPILYKPYYRDQRMCAQGSEFMVWGSNTSPFDTFFSEKNYLRSNKVGNGRTVRGNYNEIIFLFNIYADRKQSILRELDSCGINERTLFPGLDSIGRYVEMKYRFDLEEAKKSV
jgi:hypothetical protein